MEKIFISATINLYNSNILLLYGSSFSMTKTTKNIFHFYTARATTSHQLPLLLTHIQAGFPSPAESYSEKSLDLNELIIKHPAATFFVKVEGDSMIDAGIRSGDILVVDRALEVADNKIVIVQLNGEFTVKRIKKINQELYLVPENTSFKAIKVTEEMNFEIWGVVSYVIHQVR